MPRMISRASTCLQLRLNERCDNCQYLHVCESVARKPNPRKNTTCKQPWTWEILPSTKSATKNKKAKVLAKINRLGYVFEDKNTHITSRNYVVPCNTNIRVSNLCVTTAKNNTTIISDSEKL